MSLVNECELLQAIDLFKDFEQSKCKLIAMSSDRLEYQRGDVLFREGDPSDSVFFLLGGTVRVVKEDELKSVEIAKVFGGSVLGEMGVICGVSRNSTLIALEPSTVLRTDARVFMELLETVPQLALSLARILAIRLEWTGNRIVDLKTTSSLAEEV